MKICFIAPGEIEIPPNGWGALETVLWNQFNALKELGEDVYFINEKDTELTYKKVLEINPDVVHLHYGKHWEIMPLLNCKKIITSHDGSFLQSIKFHEHLVRNFYFDCSFFVLTSWEKDFLLQIGISPNSIKILPNGVNYNKFKKSEKPNYENKSVCLGKIDKRKRQTILQKQSEDVVFVGDSCDEEFNKELNYLGRWNREEVYENLTHYASLILLSSSELQPLVCLEAMSAGLGLIISEACVENLDLSKNFITVIPDNKLNDDLYIQEKIKQNQTESLKSRKEILEYAKQFNWINIGKKWLNNYMEI